MPELNHCKGNLKTFTSADASVVIILILKNLQLEHTICFIQSVFRLAIVAA
jgi:hypothetical protein